MRGNPALVIDKSALQSLSNDECDWLEQFFHLVLTPTLFLEIRADLAKASREGRTPEKEVAIIADKIGSMGTDVNVDYFNLCIADLMGETIEMRGVPAIGGGEVVTASDGSKALYFDEPLEIKTLRQWSEGDFSDEDWEFAKVWRESLAQLDLEGFQRNLNWVKDRAQNVTTLDDVLGVVDQGLGSPGMTYRLLSDMVGFLRIPDKFRPPIINNWKRAGRPMVGVYAPYATHVARVDMFFYLALARGLISPHRPSNRIDMSYLYYLPFCRVFISSDKLHKRVVPLFLTGQRMFVSGESMKADLSALKSFYDSLPDETRRKGSMNYATFPPQGEKFLTAKIYDQVCPHWRDAAKIPPIEITPERQEAIMDHLRPMLDAIKQASDEGENRD